MVGSDWLTSIWASFRVAVALGDAHHVIVELVLGVAADLHRLLFGGRHIGDDGLYVFQIVESEADDAAGEVGVAAPEVFGGFLHHHHRLAGLSGGDSGGQRRVPRANYDNVIFLRHLKWPPCFFRKFPLLPGEG